MQHETVRGKVLAPVPAAPPIAAFLLVCAGVAIAQPRERSMAAQLTRSGPMAPQFSAATIRIVLPPPTAAARPSSRKSDGPVRISLDHLAPTPAPAALAPTRSLPPVSPAPPLVPVGAAQHQADLATPGSDETADFSATMREISASLGSAPIARMDGAPHSHPGIAPADPGTLSDTTRQSRRAAQPSETELIGSKAGRDDPMGHSDHAQAILSDIMKPKPRSIPTVSLQVSATVNGSAAGRVLLLINDAENISVRLRELLAILEPALGPALYARLSGSQSAQTYMTLNDLRAAGIAASFDDRDRLVLATPREEAP